MGIGAALLLGACRETGDRAPAADAAAEPGYEVVVPASAQQQTYVCEGSSGFTLHVLPDTAWVALPERTVRLPRDAAAPGTRYSNGDIDFTMENDVARLETEAQTFSQCRRSGA
jgi:hypothetical protein